MIYERCTLWLLVLSLLIGLAIIVAGLCLLP